MHLASVTPQNPVYFAFYGDVSEARIEPFKSAFFRGMNESGRGKSDHAFIMFYSLGGENRAGLQLHGFLSEHKANITVFNMGAVCSAAATMFLAIPIERRLMADHAVFMVHGVRIGIEGKMTLPEVRNCVADAEREDGQIRDIVCRETTITPSRWEIESAMSRDMWFTRDDALEHRFVSSIGGFLIPKPKSADRLMAL